MECGLDMHRENGSFDRRKFILGGAGLLAASAASGAQGSYSDSSFAGGPIAGPFRPYWESLKAYRFPDWFRDAKFGMWAHWTPQCVPEQGDWYARGMYVQGHNQYNYHVKTYGHPSKFGKPSGLTGCQSRHNGSGQITTQSRFRLSR